MKILHTSDWHLGTFLDTKEKTRIPEQIKFIDELFKICSDEKIDLIIIAGDVFDTYVPTAEAEALFFDAIERLSDGGKRPVIIIAGNHDDPKRLTAANPVLQKYGVVVLGTPNSYANDFENEYTSVKSLQKCCFELNIKSINESAVIAAMPYPSEKRLNKRLTSDCEFNENILQKNYSYKIKTLFDEMSAFFRDDTINIAIGHFYVAGSEMSTGSERDISLGGGFAVLPSHLPQNADYIALGHLHRPQSIADGKAFYSGSPIAYSISEIHYAKCVYVANLAKGRKDIKKVFVSCPKPLEIWNFLSIEEAIKYCCDNRDKECFAYITIKTKRPLYQHEIKEMKQSKQDIVKIEAITEAMEQQQTQAELLKEKTISEDFFDFYKSVNSNEPPGEILALFEEILQAAQEEGAEG